jgi:hypothetical protein
LQPGGPTDLQKTHYPQIRIEIPSPSNIKRETLTGPVIAGENVKAKAKDSLAPLKPLGKLRGRPPKAKSVICVSMSPLSPTQASGNATIHPDDSSISQQSKFLMPNPKASLITQRRKGNFSVFIPNTVHSETAKGKDEAVFKGAASKEGQNLSENLRSTSKLSYNYSAPAFVQSTHESNGEPIDKEDGGGLLRQLQLLRSTYRGTARASGNIVQPAMAKKGRIRNVSETVGEAYSNSDDDILDHYLPRVAFNSKLDGTRLCSVQRRRESVRHSSSTPGPSADNRRLSNDLRSASALPPRKFSKHPKSSPASFLDIESEDDLAAGQQLLRKFQGQRHKSAESAETILQQFKPISLKQPSSTSSPPKSWGYQGPSTLAAKLPIPTKSASARRKSSMTSPFPPGKSIQRSSAFRSKDFSNSRASKSHLLPAENDDRFSPQKKKRVTYTHSPRNATGGNDPDADWRPPR